jgi:hypothetical protein
MAAPMGHIQVTIDGHVRLKERGGAFTSLSRTIKVGYNPSLSTTQRQYLDSHNRRRQDWHRRLGKTYRPLKWAPSLANDAQNWANTLRDRTTTCHLTNSDHASGTNSAENMASNFGTGSWGAKPTPDQIVGRFVDREENLQFNRNSHLLAALWWSTGYVGCGESFKVLSNGDNCHIQVCRYQRTGVCDVRSLTNLATDPHGYQAMMTDDLNSRCGAFFPREGVF